MDEWSSYRSEQIEARASLVAGLIIVGIAIGLVAVGYGVAVLLAIAGTIMVLTGLRDLDL